VERREAACLAKARGTFYEVPDQDVAPIGAPLPHVCEGRGKGRRPPRLTKNRGDESRLYECACLHAGCLTIESGIEARASSALSSPWPTATSKHVPTLARRTRSGLPQHLQSRAPKMHVMFVVRCRFYLSGNNCDQLYLAMQQRLLRCLWNKQASATVLLLPSLMRRLRLFMRIGEVTMILGFAMGALTVIVLSAGIFGWMLWNAPEESDNRQVTGRPT
jgi:hypothetical protein